MDKEPGPYPKLQKRVLFACYIGWPEDSCPDTKIVFSQDVYVFDSYGFNSRDILLNNTAEKSYHTTVRRLDFSITNISIYTGVHNLRNSENVKQAAMKLQKRGYCHQRSVHKSPGRDLIRERMVGKLEKGHSLTSVAEEFGINKRAFSSVWEACQTISKAVRNIVAGHLRKTTA
ncbi:UNVERIFIED_CONTAM: hypothetical protein NCL1_10320 [Trichonephila clavipes]